MKLFKIHFNYINSRPSPALTWCICFISTTETTDTQIGLSYPVIIDRNYITFIFISIS